MRLVAVGLVAVLCAACVTVQVAAPSAEKPSASPRPSAKPGQSPVPSNASSLKPTETPAVQPTTDVPQPSGRPVEQRGDGPGVVRGFVYGAEGKNQPIPLAFVTTGSVSTLAGNPDEAKAVAEDNEFDNPDDAKKQHFDVMHDFNDGNGAVPTDRILRQQVPPEDPDADYATNERRGYVYLRKGEFFLEGLPAGTVNLTASFGNVVSPPQAVTVPDHQAVTGVRLSLPLPEPVGDSHVVEWTSLKPETGISVNAEVKSIQTEEGLRTETTLTYKPDPPNVVVTLKAPPGSQGTTIEAVDLIYVYNTPARQAVGSPPVQIGPVRMPIEPVTVLPAQDIAFGPPASITVPIGSSSLRSVFRSNLPDQQPGLIVANMEFIDSNGRAVQDKKLQNLQVSATIRSL